VASTTEWRRLNPTKHVASTARWRARYPWKYLAQTQNQRAKRAGAEGRLTGAELEARFAEQGGICALCGVGPPLTVDHIVPMSAGGPNLLPNIRFLCQPCNSRESDRLRARESWPKGEQRVNARFTEADVRTIRARYAAGGITGDALAAEYGVSRSAIYAVLTRFTWSHVT
jgi:5-methylcytosine-specific restriction endonuclease McrA